ncbi:hypothetical protein D3C75_1158640 [compost metagenome]
MTAVHACGGKGAVDIEGVSGEQQNVQHVLSCTVQKQAVSRQQLVDCRFSVAIHIGGRRVGHEVGRRIGIDHRTQT